MDKVEITKAALANLRKHEDCAMSFHAKGTGGRGPAELHLYGPAALAVYRIYSMGNDAAAAIEALQAQVAARDAEETGWLIEHEDEPKWLTLKPGEATYEVCWTKDSLEALRFARREDADDYVMRFMEEEPIRITEHIWTRAALGQGEG